MDEPSLAKMPAPRIARPDDMAAVIRKGSLLSHIYISTQEPCG